MKRDKIIGVIFIALGILVALTPCVIAPTCGPMENGMFMKCHWMGSAVMGSGVMMAILGCAYFYVCSSNVKFAFGFSFNSSCISNWRMHEQGNDVSSQNNAYCLYFCRNLLIGGNCCNDFK